MIADGLLEVKNTKYRGIESGPETTPGPTVLSA